MKTQMMSKEVIAGIIMMLRIVGVLFNGFMVLISISVCRRIGASLLLGLSLFGVYFGGQALLALIPMRKVHKSKIITLALISITGLLPVGLLIRCFIDILNQKIDLSIDPAFAFVFPTAILLFSSVPLLLFLEYKRSQ